MRTLELSVPASERALHDQFRRALAFPEHYGCNLDALYDCLTDLSEPTRIRVPPGFAAALGGYGARAVRVLMDAAMRNANLRVDILY